MANCSHANMLSLHVVRSSDPAADDLLRLEANLTLSKCSDTRSQHRPPLYMAHLHTQRLLDSRSPHRSSQSLGSLSCETWTILISTGHDEITRIYPLILSSAKKHLSMLHRGVNPLSSALWVERSPEWRAAGTAGSYPMVDSRSGYKHWSWFLRS